MIYASHQLTPPIFKFKPHAGIVLDSDGKGKELYQWTIKHCSAYRRCWEKNKRPVWRQAGRKCFLFQSVLYPLVIKKGTKKKEGELLKSMKKVHSAPGAGCPLLMSFHKHFVRLSGWWGYWTAYWMAAWSLGQFLRGTSKAANMNYTSINFLCPSMPTCSVTNQAEIWVFVTIVCYCPTTTLPL